MLLVAWAAVSSKWAEISDREYEGNDHYDHKDSEYPLKVLSQIGLNPIEHGINAKAETVDKGKGLSID